MFVSADAEKYNVQVLEWYTSTLEVRMSQDVGVRVSSWIQLQKEVTFFGVFYIQVYLFTKRHVILTQICLKHRL